jgi:MYXO-CTERM domain-containing protein
MELVPQLAAVTAQHVNPTYDPTAPFHGDLGVVVLAEPIDATPLPVNRAPVGASLAGPAARIVGYGQTTYMVFNEAKNDATTVVDSVGSDDTLAVGDDTHKSCVGDSGGPALVKVGGVETIVGVDSYTDVAGCLDPANYRRPDLYLSFIDTYAPPPAADAGAGAGGGGGSEPATTTKGGCATAPGAEGGAIGAAVVTLGLAWAAARRRRRARCK